MSRRSKRRRLREGLPPQTAAAPEPADAFDFQDDRIVPPVPQAPPVPVPVKVATGPPRMASVPARGRKTPTPAPAPAETAATTAVLDAPAPESAAAAAAVSTHAPHKAHATSAPPAPAPAPVAPPPLGALLTAGREARGLSIGEASARTRISSRMLENLEKDRWNEFAAAAYARGFLRNYATFLGLDVAMLMARHEALHGHPVPAAREEDAWEPDVEAAPAPPRAPRARPSRRTLAIGGIAAGVAVLAALGIYLAHQGLLDLRPAAGLEQIEHELRRTQPPVASPVTPHADAPVAVPSTESAPVESSAAVEPRSASPGAPSPATGPRANDKPPLPLPTLRREDASPPVPPVGPTLRREDASPPVPPVAPTLRREDTSAAVPTLRREAEPVDVDAGVTPPTREETVPSPTDRPGAAGGPAAHSGPLVLTATALDTCAVRLQVDAEGKRAQRWSFSSRGESRSWTARRSFRLVVHRSQNLELRLNGRLVPVPSDGRTVVFDHQTLGPVQQPVSAPKPRSGRRARAARSG